MAETVVAPATVLPASSLPASSLPASPPPARERPTGSGVALRTVAVLYVGILALVPVIVIVYRTFQPGLAHFGRVLSDPATVHAFEVSGIVAGIAVVINTVFGIAVGILLARYRFPGKRLLSAFVDLPVAVSPIVVGLALVLVFGPSGWFGTELQGNGLQIIGAKPGMVLATAFVSLPLIVRAVVPVLEQAGTDQEQAATSLGAHAVQRFLRITLPSLRVALTYGVVLCLARCIGEYGAVLVVSNNIEGQTETATLRVSNYVETAQDPASAYVITFVLILVAFAAIAVSAWIRHRQERR